MRFKFKIIIKKHLINVTMFNYQLKNEDYIENEEEIDVYVEKIRENKQQYQNDFYFGAYRIRNNEVELIKNSIKEIYRFCVKNK